MIKFFKTFAVALLLSLFSASYTEVMAQKVKFEITIGRFVKNCHGLWVCGGKVGNLSSELTAEGSLEGEMMTLSFQKPLPKFEDNKYFFAEEGENFEFSPELARAFGKSSITLKAGKYAIDYSRNPNGVVVIPVVAR